MKQLSMILLAALLTTATVKGQIVTPSGVIQASSGTNGVGIGFIGTPQGLLHVQNGCVLFNGNIGLIPVGLTGPRMMWIPDRAAFRAGDATSTRWDPINIGLRSGAMGFETIASGENSFAVNSGTEASQPNSFAANQGTQATALNATAFGFYTDATGNNSFATGSETKAQGANSFSSGINTIASGDASAAFNNTAQATSYGAFAANLAKATGDNSFAIGAATASNSKSFAGGNSSVEAGGLYSFAFGGSARAMGDYSFAALGGETTGGFSVAIGHNCSDGGHDGAISFSDMNINPVVNQANNEFRARAAGGFVFHSDGFMTAPNTLTYLNGNLGVGVTTPATEKIDIDGRLRVRDIPLNTNSSTQVLVNNGGVINYRDIPALTSNAWSRAPSGIPTSINDNIYRNGRIGVGTSSPNAQVHLANASCGLANLQLSANSGCGTAGDLLVGQDQSGATKFVVKPTGSVGIGGTLNPLMHLDVYRGDLIFTGGSTTFRFHNQWWMPNGDFFLNPASINGVMLATGIAMGTNGHVGIGTNSNATHRLDVNGSVISSVGYFISDKRFKKDITHVDNALELILSLDGVKYTYKDNVEIPGLAAEGKPVMREFPKGTQIGLIAQDVEKVLPEVVATDEDGYKAVAYQNIVPLLIEGVKEQQAIIETQNAKIAELEERLAKLEKGGTTGIGSTGTPTVNGAALYQNTPNPFNSHTEIGYKLPEQYNEAKIMVFDMNGRQVRVVALTGEAEGKVSFYPNELAAGMYMYSLVIDGQEIDTKRMILSGR